MSHSADVKKRGNGFRKIYQKIYICRLYRSLLNLALFINRWWNVVLIRKSYGIINHSTNVVEAHVTIAPGLEVTQHIAGGQTVRLAKRRVSRDFLDVEVLVRFRVTEQARLRRVPARPAIQPQSNRGHLYTCFECIELKSATSALIIAQLTPEIIDKRWQAVR